MGKEIFLRFFGDFLGAEVLDEFFDQITDFKDFARKVVGDRFDPVLVKLELICQN